MLCGLNLGFDFPLSIGENQAGLLCSLSERLCFATLQHAHPRQVVTGDPVGQRALFQASGLIRHPADRGGNSSTDYADNGDRDGISIK